jgi:hypothetical protein
MSEDATVLPHKSPVAVAVSPSGKRWTIMRGWRDSNGRPGIALANEKGRSMNRYLVDQVAGGVPRLGAGWRLEVKRSAGAVVGCPMCGAQFGGMVECPWDDVLLWPLVGVGEHPDDAVAVAFYGAIR